MSRLIAAARRYVGVRFRHRGRSEKGLDCAGLGWLAYHDCGIELEDFRLYGREPHKDGLVTRLSSLLGDPVAVAPVTAAQLQVGDVIVLRFQGEPHHVAFVGDYFLGGFSMIHADGEAANPDTPKKPGRVVEHRMAPDHVARITHVFRRPV